MFCANSLMLTDVGFLGGGGVLSFCFFFIPLPAIQGVNPSAGGESLTCQPVPPPPPPKEHKGLARERKDECVSYSLVTLFYELCFHVTRR